MLAALFAAMALMAASTPSETAAPAAQPAAADKDEMVCHREMVVGSTIPKKVCVKRSELGARNAKDRRLVDEVQRNIIPPTR